MLKRNILRTLSIPLRHYEITQSNTRSYSKHATIYLFRGFRETEPTGWQICFVPICRFTDLFNFANGVQENIPILLYCFVLYFIVFL